MFVDNCRSITAQNYQITNSLRLRSSANSYLSRTPSSVGNLKTWTWSGWVKRGTLGSLTPLFTADDGTLYGNLAFTATDTLRFYNPIDAINTENVDYSTTAVFRDPSAHYHVVLQVDTTNAVASDRVIFYVNGTRMTATVTVAASLNRNLNINRTISHQIGAFTRISNYCDGYISDVYLIDGQALTPSYFGQTDTNGVWNPKVYSGSYGTNGFYLKFNDGSNITNLCLDSKGGQELITNGHFTTNTTGWTVIGGGTPTFTVTSGAGRLANGSNNASGTYQAISTIPGQTYYVQCRVFNINLGATTREARLLASDSTTVLSGTLLAALAQSSGGGRLSGSFVATATTTYIHLYTDNLGGGTYADFDDVSVGTSDYKNNWTATNVSLTAGYTYDWSTDTPSNNYCTLNPIDPAAISAGTTLSNANTYTTGGTAAYSRRFSTWGAGGNSSLGISSGKWYYEFYISGLSTGNNVKLGAGVPLSGYYYEIDATDNAGNLNYSISGATSYNAAGLGSSAIGHTMMIALDLDNGKIWFGANGSWSTFGGASPNPATGVSPCYSGITVAAPYAGAYSTGSGGYINFGSRPFTYTPPTGFKALCTQNIPVAVIANPKKHFDVLTWTGNGVNNRNIGGLQFTPDLLWPKSRSQARSHTIYDVVRGVGVNKQLSSNGTGVEGDVTVDTAQFGYISAITTDGFTATQGSSGTIPLAYLNNNAETYGAWNWKANGTGISNTSGTITSTVSANTTAGFSIVTWTGVAGNVGKTVGHGLNVAPKLIIVKGRDGGTTGTNHWPMYHSTLGAGNFILFSFTNTSTAGTAYWNNTAPTSTVFSIGGDTNNINNESGIRYVAYCWTEVTGYSKFGSYTGNASGDGPFVYCGFKPRYVLIKGSTNISEWYIWDSARNPYNVANLTLNPNQSAAEYSAGSLLLDLNANGFKVRDTVGSWNTNGQTYIFAAFAESPFGGSNISPATAR